MQYPCLPMLALAIAVPTVCSADVIDFESLSDGDVITNQFSAQGVLFSNAVALAAGISLNEFEFPPHSGSIVAAASADPLEIDFTTPVDSFFAFFTYGSALTLQVFDPSNNLLSTISSAFSNNEAISGDAGSSPNEELGLSAPSIGRITVTNGNQAITIDDLTFTQATTGAVPEPSAFVLLLSVLTVLRVSQLLIHFRPALHR